MSAILSGLKNIPRAVLFAFNLALSDDSESDAVFESKISGGWSLLTFRLTIFVPFFVILFAGEALLGLSLLGRGLAAVFWLALVFAKPSLDDDDEAVEPKLSSVCLLFLIRLAIYVPTLAILLAEGVLLNLSMLWRVLAAAYWLLLVVLIFYLLTRISEETRPA